MYDRICSTCDKHLIDCWEPITTPSVPCPSCGGETSRAWLSKPPAAIPDDIPGGVWIRHAICNEDGSPRKYYSKSEIEREAKSRGYSHTNTHVTGPGTDKNKFTTRWI